MPAPDMSDTTTHGFRVGATAFFLPEESDPDQQSYTFGYRIVISNEGDRPARLVSRQWDIIDADGHHREVEGAGVVGQSPHLPPGQAFKYTSFAILKTDWGTMEGQFTMQDDAGETFTIDIGRFWLTPASSEPHEVAAGDIDASAWDE